MSARVARLRPPGPWWYVAVCADCGWSSRLTWKHKAWAVAEVEEHDKRQHDDSSGIVASVASQLPGAAAPHLPAPLSAPTAHSQGEQT